jgi:hypothetical protein
MPVWGCVVTPLSAVANLPAGDAACIPSKTLIGYEPVLAPVVKVFLNYEPIIIYGKDYSEQSIHF